MARPNVKTNFILEFIKSNGYDENIPTRTIARALHQKFPQMFEDLEATRTLVRRLRGNQGEYQRIKREDKSLYRQNQDPAVIGRQYSLNPIDISIPDFIFNHKKPLILSDIHLPYHDLKAVLIALEHGEKNYIDSIYLNGDTLDFASRSRFMKPFDIPTWSEERDMFWDFVDMLKDRFDVPIFFKAGNHEARWEHKIMQSDAELLLNNEFHLDRLLHLDELGIQYISSLQKCLMGKLIVIHGHEFGEGVFSPVNPARGMFTKAKSSVLFGHNHQVSEHSESNLKGEQMACFSTGCLCQMTPSYRPFGYTKWSHGFAVVEIDEDGMFEVSNHRIVNGKVK